MSENRPLGESLDLVPPLPMLNLENLGKTIQACLDHYNNNNIVGNIDAEAITEAALAELYFDAVFLVPTGQTEYIAEAKKWAGALVSYDNGSKYGNQPDNLRIAGSRARAHGVLGMIAVYEARALNRGVKKATKWRQRRNLLTEATGHFNQIGTLNFKPTEIARFTTTNLDELEQRLTTAAVKQQAARETPADAIGLTKEEYVDASLDQLAMYYQTHRRREGRTRTQPTESPVPLVAFSPSSPSTQEQPTARTEDGGSYPPRRSPDTNSAADPEAAKRGSFLTTVPEVRIDAASSHLERPITANEPGQFAFDYVFYTGPLKGRVTDVAMADVGLLIRMDTGKELLVSKYRESYLKNNRLVLEDHIITGISKDLSITFDTGLTQERDLIFLDEVLVSANSKLNRDMVSIIRDTDTKPVRRGDERKAIINQARHDHVRNVSIHGITKKDAISLFNDALVSWPKDEIDRNSLSADLIQTIENIYTNNGYEISNESTIVINKVVKFIIDHDYQKYGFAKEEDYYLVVLFDLPSELNTIDQRLKDISSSSPGNENTDEKRQKSPTKPSTPEHASQTTSSATSPSPNQPGDESGVGADAERPTAPFERGYALRAESIDGEIHYQAVRLGRSGDEFTIPGVPGVISANQLRDYTVPLWEQNEPIDNQHLAIYLRSDNSPLASIDADAREKVINQVLDYIQSAPDRQKDYASVAFNLIEWMRTNHTLKPYAVLAATSESRRGKYDQIRNELGDSAPENTEYLVNKFYNFIYDTISTEPNDIIRYVDLLVNGRLVSLCATLYPLMIKPNWSTVYPPPADTSVEYGDPDRKHMETELTTEQSRLIDIATDLLGRHPDENETKFVIDGKPLNTLLTILYMEKVRGRFFSQEEWDNIHHPNYKLQTHITEFLQTIYPGSGPRHNYITYFNNRVRRYNVRLPLLKNDILTQTETNPPEGTTIKTVNFNNNSLGNIPSAITRVAYTPEHGLIIGTDGPDGVAIIIGHSVGLEVPKGNDYTYEQTIILGLDEQYYPDGESYPVVKLKLSDGSENLRQLDSFLRDAHKGDIRPLEIKRPSFTTLLPEVRIGADTRLAREITVENPGRFVFSHTFDEGPLAGNITEIGLTAEGILVHKDTGEELLITAYPSLYEHASHDGQGGGYDSIGSITQDFHVPTYNNQIPLIELLTRANSKLHSNDVIQLHRSADVEITPTPEAEKQSYPIDKLGEFLTMDIDELKAEADRLQYIINTEQREKRLVFHALAIRAITQEITHSIGFTGTPEDLELIIQKYYQGDDKTHERQLLKEYAERLKQQKAKREAGAKGEATTPSGLPIRRKDPKEE